MAPVAVAVVVGATGGAPSLARAGSVAGVVAAAAAVATATGTKVPDEAEAGAVDPSLPGPDAEQATRLATPNAATIRCSQWGRRRRGLAASVRIVFPMVAPVTPSRQLEPARKTGEAAQRHHLLAGNVPHKTRGIR